MLVRPEKRIIALIDEPNVLRLKLSGGVSQALDRILVSDLDTDFVATLCSPRSGYNLATAMAYRFEEYRSSYHRLSALDRIAAAGVNVGRPDARGRIAGFAVSLAFSGGLEIVSVGEMERWEALGITPASVQIAGPERNGQRAWEACSLLSHGPLCGSNAAGMSELQDCIDGYWNTLDTAGRAQLIEQWEQAPVDPSNLAFFEEKRDAVMAYRLLERLPPDAQEKASRPRL